MTRLRAPIIACMAFVIVAILIGSAQAAMPMDMARAEDIVEVKAGAALDADVREWRHTKADPRTSPPISDYVSSPMGLPMAAS